MSNVRSQPLPPRLPESVAASEGSRRRRPRIGVVKGAHVEGAFLALIYGAVALLVVLSLFGTFYGLAGRDAPLAEPWRMALDAYGAPRVLLTALLIQGVLTVAQWGARQMARHNRYWWLAWLAALAPSVYYNVGAYHTPAVALGAPWLVAFVLIVAGDIVPELVSVQQD